MKRLIAGFFNAIAAMGVMMFIMPVATAGTILATMLFVPLPAVLPDARPTIRSQITHIYDINGQEIGIFRIFETSIPVRQQDIPEVLKNAVIAAEDRNFYSHGGIDPRAIVRAFVADVRGGQLVQGGSTITQQFVKNAYTDGDRTITRKIREAILAAQLDRQQAKDEILFQYLDSIYLGEGAFGVGAAAETYFRKPVQDLTIAEAATIAGLIPAPSRYSPRVNAKLSEEKRLLVLNAMREEELISPQQYAEALPQKVALEGTVEEGEPATIIYPPLRQETVHPYFVDYVRRYLLDGIFTEEELFRGGLEIYTTLDPAMQTAAEEEVARTLDGTESPLEMSLASVEPATGYVKALVGGRDFTENQVNLALGRSMGYGGRSFGRQPGSSFKPFVLATALSEGIKPTATYSGATHTVGDYTAQNYGGSSYGTLNLVTATRKSVNTVYTRLMNDVGVEDTIDMANKLGGEFEPYDASRHGLAVALGALETSPLSMAAGYSVFANRGRRAPASPVIYVLDKDGNPVFDNARSHEEADQVLDEVVADTVTDILQGVLQPGGTAGSRGINRPAAGKTGTTQDSRDAWFVGYTPNLSTAIWMGYREHPDGLIDENGDVRKVPALVGIKGVRQVTGGSLPAQTWQAFMKRALADVEATDFNEPAPIQDFADQQRRRERGGFDIGSRARISSSGETVNPSLDPPQTRTPIATTSTTSTTLPPGGSTDDDDDTGGGGGGRGGGGGVTPPPDGDCGLVFCP